MRYCFECGHPVHLVCHEDRQTGSGTMMGCIKCKSIFMLCVHGTALSPDNPGWQKQNFKNLDQLMRELQQYKPYQH